MAFFMQQTIKAEFSVNQLIDKHLLEQRLKWTENQFVVKFSLSGLKLLDDPLCVYEFAEITLLCDVHSAMFNFEKFQVLYVSMWVLLH